MRNIPHNFSHFKYSKYSMNFKYSMYSMNSNHLNNLTYKY